MLHILISDDHAVFRRGIRDILIEHLEPVHIEEAESGDVMLHVAAQRRWDVFMMDITMPGTSGVDLLQGLVRISPATPVLVFSVHPEATYAVRMLQAGASGYLNKATSPKELVNAIQSVIAGRRYINSQVADCLLDSLHKPLKVGRHDKLSNREFATLRFLASGKPLKGIAVDLGVSVNTVSTYRLRLLKKLGLSSNAELTRYAIEHSLLE